MTGKRIEVEIGMEVSEEICELARVPIWDNDHRFPFLAPALSIETKEAIIFNREKLTEQILPALVKLLARELAKNDTWNGYPIIDKEDLEGGKELMDKGKKRL
jgi:hypothetical protein